MSYTGVKTQGEGIGEILHRAKKSGAGLLSSSHANSHVVVARENAKSPRTRCRDDVLCVLDGQLLFLGEPRSKKKPSSRQAVVDLVIGKWMREGDAVLQDMDVTASISIYDSDSDRLVLARAQNGIPPLFFAEKQNALLWSNSIKSLLECGISAELDSRALDAYLALGYVPSPWTLFAEIRKVPAGQYLDWDGDDWEFKGHREPVPRTRPAGDIEARTTQFKECLCRSLDRMVEGYDRVGVLLSGGVDSSLLVGLLHCELGAQVEAFTFEYSDYEGKYNEYDQARRLTSRYDIPHHHINYSGEWLEANLEGAVREYEEPFTYGHHTARLQEVVQSDITLLLNGVKGSTHISRTADYALRIQGSFAERVAGAGKSVLETKLLRRLSRLRHAFDIIESSASELFYRMPVDRVVPDPVRRRLYADPDRVCKGRTAILSLFEEEVRRSGLRRKADQLSHLHNQFSVPDHFLWWNYRWARAYGLKMGAPFLMPGPRKFMESLRQPLWPPYHESVRKVLIRRVAATVMPDEIAYREKIAQTSPFWVWFRGPLHSLIREYIQPSRIREQGLFDADFVDKETRKHISGTGRKPYLIWSLLCFMVWRCIFSEG